MGILYLIHIKTIQKTVRLELINQQKPLSTPYKWLIHQGQMQFAPTAQNTTTE